MAGPARLLGRGDPAGHDGRVLANADEERRLAFSQEVHAGEVEPGVAVLEHSSRTGKPSSFEGARASHPGLVVGPEAAGEDHRAEALEVQLLAAVGAERLGVGHCPARAVPAPAPSCGLCP